MKTTACNISALAQQQTAGPVRLYEGDAKPHERFWRMRNQGETGGDPELELYGVLSEFSWLEDDITPKMFKDDLFRLGNGGPITLRIDSPGGDFSAASVMRSIIATYPGKVTARVDGLCASAATIVALAAEKVKMQDSAMFMIHEPWIGMLGTATIDFLNAVLDELQAGVRTLVGVYSAKTGISDDRLKRMMHDETWMSAQDAVALGFVDEILRAQPAGSRTVKNSAVRHMLLNYAHVPPSFMSSLQPKWS